MFNGIKSIKQNPKIEKTVTDFLTLEGFEINQFPDNINHLGIINMMNYLWYAKLYLGEINKEHYYVFYCYNEINYIHGLLIVRQNKNYSYSIIESFSNQISTAANESSSLVIFNDFSKIYNRFVDHLYMYDSEMKRQKYDFNRVCFLNN